MNERKRLSAVIRQRIAGTDLRPRAASARRNSTPYSGSGKARPRVRQDAISHDDLVARSIFNLADERHQACGEDIRGDVVAIPFHFEELQHSIHGSDGARCG